MNVTVAQLPLGSHYDTGWVTTKIPFGEQIESFDYHSRTDSYAIGTSRKADYKLSVEDVWASEGEFQDRYVSCNADVRIRNGFPTTSRARVYQVNGS